jgi:hypothetical protein
VASNVGLSLMVSTPGSENHISQCHMVHVMF